MIKCPECGEYLDKTDYFLICSGFKCKFVKVIKEEKSPYKVMFYIKEPEREEIREKAKTLSVEEIANEIGCTPLTVRKILRARKPKQNEHSRI